MAYRAAREAGHSHHDALATAKAVYFWARPEAVADRLEASARINEMIASAIQANARWFWKTWAADHQSERSPQGGTNRIREALLRLSAGPSTSSPRTPVLNSAGQPLSPQTPVLNWAPSSPAGLFSVARATHGTRCSMGGHRAGEMPCLTRSSTRQSTETDRTQEVAAIIGAQNSASPSESGGRHRSRRPRGGKRPKPLKPE